MTFETDQNALLTYVIAQLTVTFVCVYNKLFQKSFH
jgi:hypothetical protein